MMIGKQKMIYWHASSVKIQAINKCQSIPKGQSKMDKPEKLATQGTQDEEKQIYVGHHYMYMQTNTNNVNKTRALLQTTGVYKCD